MKKYVLIAALVILPFLLFGCVSNGDSGNGGNGAAAGKTVSMQNFAFGPAEITIKKGDTVKWTNLDSVAHTVTSDDGAFDSGLLSQNASWSKTFNEAGTFEYHCTPHPYMKAKIIVEE
ncbi:MAG: cupredoxin family copper-binding protein [Candidatus Diapherotrites archaeon]|nr:cupredoxin family copper-binding protein [Candidatus Diapherotrites archaeon]